jgi:hypothetical protein
MRIGINPVTGQAVLAAAQEWLDANVRMAVDVPHPFELGNGKRRRILSQRFLVMLHGGQYASKWRVVRSGTQATCQRAYESWCKKAPRSFVVLLACPYEYDEKELRRLGWGTGEWDPAAMIERNRKLRIVDSRLADLLAQRFFLTLAGRGIAAAKALIGGNDVEAE